MVTATWRPRCAPMALGLALAACSDGSGVFEITEFRDKGRPARVDVSVSDRFRLFPANPGAAPRDRNPRGTTNPHATKRSGAGGGQDMQKLIAGLLKWQPPEGWEQLPAAQFRDINMRVGEIECYVSVLLRGGALLNINRWRGQMQLERIDTGALAALPKIAVLGQQAHRVDLKGSFVPRGGEPKSGYRMLAAFAQMPVFALTIKMLGPAAEVAKQEENFDSFCASIEIDKVKARALTSEPGGAAHGGNGNSNDQDTGSAIDVSKLAWDVPKGWIDAGAKTMRHVSFKAGAAESYISIIGSNWGSAVENVNRWHDEVAKPHVLSVSWGDYPEIEVLGRKCARFEAFGDTKGLLVTIVPVGGLTLFIKLRGARADVEAEKKRYIEFCKSLRIGK